jgi:2-aminobenzoate-CoA ligase
VKDTFILDRLPPKRLWPEMPYGSLQYPDRLNVVHEIVDVWTRGPDRPAILFRDMVWTYRDLAGLSNQLCRVLVEDHGIRSGSRVLLRSFNHPWLIASLIAIWRAGAIAVPSMPVLRAQELSHIVAKARIEIAISQSELADDIEQVRGSGSDLKTVLYFGADQSGLEQAIKTKSSATYLEETAAADPALVAFTSGTTGTPKATVHFHRDLLAVTDTFVREALSPSERDVFCGTPQIGFLYGLCGFVLDPMRFGASVILEERLTPEALVDVIRRQRPSICFTTPSALPRMIRALTPGERLSLRLVVVGGEPLPDVAHDSWVSLAGIPIINGLGVSELLHIFAASRIGNYRHGFVGPAVRGYQIKVADELGTPKRPNELGYLFVKGPTGCRYLDDLERQAAYVVDGWNRTGDLCRMDADGVACAGRSDEMIVTSGYNVSPFEVEATLLQHPRVKECAVIGVPDPERTSIVTAYVVLDRPGGTNLESDIIAFARANLSPFKCPRALVIVEELPRTANGKIRRASLRAMSRVGGK